LSPLPDGERVSLQELRTILQCSPDEPDLVGDRGSVLLATKMVPPTRETIRLMATWVESRCDVWAKCNDELKRFDSGETREWGVGGKKGAMDSPFQVRLLRVLQGKLYIDWPFNHKQRFGKLAATDSPNSDYLDRNKYNLLQLVLGKLKRDAVPDSAFFFGEEVAFMPFNFPFFAFSASPTMKNADMPWPWNAHQQAEVALFKRYFGVGGKQQQHLLQKQGKSKVNMSTDAIIARMNEHAERYNSMNTTIWSQKKSKAAFYGAMSAIRHIFFDVAAMHPELIDAGWTGGINSLPWNPQSIEAEIPYDKLKKAIDDHHDQQNIKGGTGRMALNEAPGYLTSLFKSHIFEGHGINYVHASAAVDDRLDVPPTDKYKYLVVLIGGSGAASADRLATMMLHSGAVLLIQKHDFEYHFSARLKAWVHYVPLSYTTADLVDKILWLQQNDHLARILAHNARSFALSHLRLEDMVCYAANALALVGSVPSSEPFEPILIDPVSSNREAYSQT